MNMHIRKLIFGRRIGFTLVRAAVLAVFLYVVFTRFVTFCRIAGHSMEPTFLDGRLCLVSLRTYKTEPPDRGDIVVIATTGRRTFYLKRVLALPGDRIAFNSGYLMVNGSPVPEPYIKTGGQWSMPPLEIATNEFFVAGDNRSMPFEDHLAGLVYRRDIVGAPIAP
jgi:signal peptidase I